MVLSERALNLKPSATLAMVAKAKAMAKEGKPVISFGAGEPDFNSPDGALRYAREAMENGHTHYTPGTGIPELREAVCGYYKDRFGLDYSPADVIIGAGAKILIYEALNCLVNPGDQVIVPAPAWVSYVEQIRLCGGKEIIVDTSGTDFIPDPAMVEKAITPKTKCMIINSPNNPTGAVYNRETVKALASLAVKHGIAVIYDEIYERLIYGNDVHHQMVAETPEARDSVIIVNGVSKSFAMTGWRIGYALGPSKIMSKMGSLQGHLTSCPCSIAQYAALGAIKESQNDTAAMHSKFSARRKMLLEILSDMPLIDFVVPSGAFYVLINIKKALGKRCCGKLIDDDLSFCEAFLESKFVAMVPGSAFLAPGHIRVSYANSPDDIAEGMKRLREFLESLT